MPCYTEWDAYLDKGSGAYRTEKAQLEAKLKAVMHIVDYYYGVERLRVPPVRHSGSPVFLEMDHLEFEIDSGAMHGMDEKRIFENISHHFSCDGIGFTLLYDLVSLLNLHDKEDAGYARVMMICASKLRGDSDRYQPTSREPETGTGRPDQPHRRRFP